MGEDDDPSGRKEVVEHPYGLWGAVGPPTALQKPWELDNIWVL